MYSIEKAVFPRSEKTAHILEHTKIRLLHEVFSFLLVPILQTILASTIIFVVSEIFSEDKNCS